LNVTATDGKTNSDMSEISFTLVTQGKAQAMVLEIDGTPVARACGGDYGKDGTRGTDRERPVGTEYRPTTFWHFTQQLNRASTRFRSSVRIAAVERR
jgi:hypothetical protein